MAQIVPKNSDQLGPGLDLQFSPIPKTSGYIKLTKTTAGLLDWAPKNRTQRACEQKGQPAATEKVHQVWHTSLGAPSQLGSALQLAVGPLKVGGP